ncbi:DMT family transporter [Pedobacter xixiisoli]|uniref:Permease of the drug/metabolite transporter (DMT) superfamily n=1 Tax=Pedobacter xixiisoli TaxID=1476464 RepID=A0A285ZP71_9SPHI|nr:EamA family transporter [Pedobacter xixiisoli]SOD11419.1 Permease of the drug/metabolite transporter (DMT) superfamily [Pedobacter xixiisoli]
MSQKKDVKLIAALFAIAIVWGTTYLGIRIAVHTIPAWFVAGFRQVVASSILLAILLYKREFKWIGWKSLGRQILVASLMIIIANGMTTVAEESIPSGLTSLLTALSPIVVFLGSLVFGLQKPSLKGFVGVIIGFSGVAFIFRDGIGDILDPNYKTGITYLAVAILGWAAGTIYTKKYTHKSSNIFLDLFYQFAYAAVAQLIIASLVSPDIDFGSWSWQSMGAIVYLGVFGSVVGFFCYNYALKKVSATEVSILSYFNTIIAIFLGWLILNETVTYDLLIATVLIILGVFITNYKKKEAK